MSLEFLSIKDLHKSQTSKFNFNSQKYFERQFSDLNGGSKCKTEIQIPEILLMNIPPNLCPSIRKRIGFKRSERSKVNLMIDFGLVPEKATTNFSQNLLKRNTQRTITASDFMGKKNIRKIYSSHDLSSVTKKMKKLSMLNERRLKGSLVYPNTPGNMDKQATLRVQFTQNQTPRSSITHYLSPQVRLSSKGKYKKEVNFINDLLIDCDTLLKDSKNIKKKILNSSKNIKEASVISKSTGKVIKN